jgi:starch phosphorylase
MTDVMTVETRVAGAELSRECRNVAVEWINGSDNSVESARARLERYLTETTWFNTQSETNSTMARLKTGPIAYFCAEFGVADWLPIYSGGLGVLAGDVLKEASDLGVPFMGIGLFYNQGFFSQKIDENGRQTEIYADLDPATLPISEVLGPDGSPLRICVPVDDHEVQVRAWRLEVGRTPLYLLDADIEDNGPEDRAITKGLYGGDRQTRILQELILGIGGVRLLQAMDIEPSVYSMNEGHAAFLGLELLRDELTRVPLDQAIQAVRRRVAYTNHTVVPAGNDIFEHDLVREHLVPYMQRHGLSEHDLLPLGGPDRFSMPILAFHLSGKANAVSQIHAEAIRGLDEWKQFPVEAVTNGVHVPTWLGDAMKSLFDQHLPGWSSGAAEWDRVGSIPAGDLWNARRAQRAQLISYLHARGLATGFSADSLTVVWARRFAQYKRADLLASDLGRLRSLACNPERPVQVVIAGKAHPRDEGGKDVMQGLINVIDGDQELASRIVFVENYKMEIAAQLVAGADIWLNTPRKPLEASGTSGMKAGDNGALHLTVTDGWAAEVDWDNVGWPLDGYDDGDDADRLYHYLENEIAPMFYERDQWSGVPGAWVERMKRSMIVTLSRYSAQRMVHEYLDKLYLPLMEVKGQP